jgi:hypothetical protein
MEEGRRKRRKGRKKGETGFLRVVSVLPLRVFKSTCTCNERGWD